MSDYCALVVKDVSYDWDQSRVEAWIFGRRIVGSKILCKTSGLIMKCLEDGCSFLRKN